MAEPAGWKTKDGQELSEQEFELVKDSIDQMLLSFTMKDWIDWFCSTFTRKQLDEVLNIEEVTLED